MRAALAAPWCRRPALRFCERCRSGAGDAWTPGADPGHHASSRLPTAPDQHAPREGAEVGAGRCARNAKRRADRCSNGHAATTDLQALRVLGLPGLPPPAAARYRDGRGHDASRDVSPGARAEAWSVAYVQPSRRPADGRFGENPNRLFKHHQFQVILKPAPDEVQQLYLQSLEAVGIDLRAHDVRFEEDNWESPTLGAWGSAGRCSSTARRSPSSPTSSRPAGSISRRSRLN